MACSNCNQEPYNCTCNAGCVDCVERDVMVIRKMADPDICNDMVEAIKGGLINSSCGLSFGTPIVSGGSVTLVGIGGLGALEYSADGGVTWQLSATFTNQSNGTRKYFIREKNNTNCVTAGNVTITNGTCTPNWQDVNPPVTECIAGKVNYKTQDGCGAFGWRATTTNCCTPAWVDVVPQVTDCIEGTIQIKTQDGCGNNGWRDTAVICTDCPEPTFLSLTPQAATCNGVNINNNAGFQIAGIQNATRFGYSIGSTYTGDNYDLSAQISAGSISVNNMAGSSTARAAIARLYNGNQDCHVDIPFTLPATNCNISCNEPVVNITIINPSCNGQASNADGVLRLNGGPNGKKYQYVQDSTFSITPDYNAATVIPTPGQTVNILSNVSFLAGQQYKDFAIRVYENTVGCFKDGIYRFVNPCYNNNGCVAPTYGAVTVQAATCNGSNISNNASFQIANIVGAVRFGYSLGETYAGDSFDLAAQISGSVSVNTMQGASTPRQWVARLYKTETCYTDVSYTVPASNCGNSCTTPGFEIAFQNATCNSGEANSNGVLSLVGISNGTKYQFCDGDVFNCTPNYDTAPVISGSSVIVLNNVGFTSGQAYKDYTVRVYNGNVNCAATKTLRVYNVCTACCSLNILEISLVN